MWLLYVGKQKADDWKCGQYDICVRGLERGIDITDDSAILLLAVQQVRRLGCDELTTRPPNVLHALVPRRACGERLKQLPCHGCVAHRHPKFWQSLSNTLVGLGLLSAMQCGMARRVHANTELTHQGLAALLVIEQGLGVLALASIVPSLDLQVALQMPPKVQSGSVGVGSADESKCARCGITGHWAKVKYHRCPADGAAPMKRQREPRAPRAPRTRQRRFE